MRKAFVTLILVVISSTAAAALPLLGVHINLDGTTFLLMPRTSEAFFRNITYDGSRGSDFLEKRNQNSSLPILLEILKSSDSDRGCKNKMIEVLSDPQFASLKPVLLFDDEIGELTVKCLTR